jgi:(2Fe-2S) ferredoxin
MENTLRYRKHILVCTNDKEGGKKCCGSVHGMALVQAFKDEILAKGIQMEVRAQKAGCFDICGKGPTVVVYPEGVFYGNVQLEDVPRIMEEHILGGTPVLEKQLSFPPFKAV